MDSRQRELQDWLHRLPEAHRPLNSALEPVSGDASFRRYFRVRAGDGPRVIMDAPPDRESLASFMDVAERLRRAGLNAPRIHAADQARGFLLLDDLGRETFLDAFSERDPVPLLDAAVDALVQMQHRADSSGLPEYDAPLLRRELQLFPDWYLQHARGRSPTRQGRRRLEAWFERIIERALSQERVLVHRDFMARNLMISDPLPGIIDFQDAVYGPVSYDPVCLFMDAFFSLPAAEVTRWLRDYHARAHAAGVSLPASPDEFLGDCRWMAVQRHLKVIGIFARIAYRDGKPVYLEDVPRFFRYLHESAAAEPELSGLLDELEALGATGSAGVSQA